jgi:hypothetical protein
MTATETGGDAFAGAGTVLWAVITGGLAAQEAAGDSASVTGEVAWVAITGALACLETGSDTFVALAARTPPVAVARLEGRASAAFLHGHTNSAALIGRGAAPKRVA